MATKQKTPSSFKMYFVEKRLRLKTFFLRMRNRSFFANLMMVLFILLTSVGTSLISLPVGLIVAGVACGVFGYLLGLE